jgi:choline dehydrogenase-like flavoprotein
VPAGTKPQRLAALAGFKGRRDDLGTTHHDAGTMRMGDNIADSVTNDFGRIHDTTNCYVAGPALFPTVGSPNPMLTGVALGRRTAFLLKPRTRSWLAIVREPRILNGAYWAFSRIGVDDGVRTRDFRSHSPALYR